MNEMLKKGIFKGLPVVNEILLCAVLLAELAERIKDWKQAKNQKKAESSVVTVESEEDPQNDDE